MKPVDQITKSILSVGILLLSTCPVNGGIKPESWSSFRNGGDSTVIGTLPQEWSEQKGIAWQQEMSGYGQSAPIIFGNTVFVTSVIGTMKETCAITAFQLQGGKQIWQAKIPASQQGPSNYMNARAAPTPVADTKNVYAFFETGNLMAVDYSGQQLWHRDIAKEFGPFESNHGIGSSLAQTDDSVILNVEHKGPSFLMAIDKRDGTTRWKIERPSGSSWTSPIVTRRPESVVISSAGSITAFEVSSGNETWRFDGLEGNSVPSPCPADGRIIVGARIPEFGSAADAAKSNLCVSVGKRHQISWRAENAVCDYASPVVDEEQAYFLNKVGVLSCVDTSTGEEIYRKRLHAECWATPVVAENGIYFFAKDGSTKIVKRGRDFSVATTNRLWDPAHPPKPETYQEAKRSHSHGTHGGRTGHPGKTPGDKKTSGGRGGRAGGMMAAMMKNDSNNDGILQADEISADFRPMLKRVDTNGDGALDETELSAMTKRFSERRKNSQAGSRDPIVYGVAAVPGTIVVRTGTRLYCLSEGDAHQQAEKSP